MQYPSHHVNFVWFVWPCFGVPVHGMYRIQVFMLRYLYQIDRACIGKISVKYFKHDFYLFLSENFTKNFRNRKKFENKFAAINFRCETPLRLFTSHESVHINFGSTCTKNFHT